jgi:hypothetical protein
MNGRRTPETLVEQTLRVEPSAAERHAVWQSIAARLREGEETDRESARRPRLVAVGVAALAVVLAAVALLPAAREPGGPLPAASSAEAAAVLNATAARSRAALPAVGPGEHLLTRTSLTVSGDRASTVDTTSWTATDGSAVVVDRERSSRPCPWAPGRECTTLDTTTTRYRAGGNVGVRSENGREIRLRPELFEWRAVVPGDEVVRLPGDRDALLASLRARAERAVREQEKRSDPHRELGGRDLRLAQVELSGLDLVVVEAVTDLLVYAPLSAGQRAAMFSLLAEAPEWYRPGSGANPIQIRDLGPTDDALGRNGTAVRIATRPTDDEARRAGEWTVDLVLDPDSGRLLEIRSYEHGRDAEPIPLTVEAQRVVDSATG